MWPSPLFFLLSPMSTRKRSTSDNGASQATKRSKTSSKGMSTLTFTSSANKRLPENAGPDGAVPDEVVPTRANGRPMRTTGKGGHVAQLKAAGEAVTANPQRRTGPKVPANTANNNMAPKEASRRKQRVASGVCSCYYYFLYADRVLQVPDVQLTSNGPTMPVITAVSPAIPSTQPAITAVPIPSHQPVEQQKGQPRVCFEFILTSSSYCLLGRHARRCPSCGTSTCSIQSTSKTLPQSTTFSILIITSERFQEVLPISLARHKSS